MLCILVTSNAVVFCMNGTLLTDPEFDFIIWLFHMACFCVWSGALMFEEEYDFKNWCEVLNKEKIWSMEQMKGGLKIDMTHFLFENVH